MKGTKELKTRIAGVRDTVKITKAMYAISAAKMARATANRRSSAAYADQMGAIVLSLGNRLGPWCRQTDAPTAWIVMAADKGLCGDYNERVWQVAEGLAIGPEDSIFCVGYMATEYYKAKGIATQNAFAYMMTNPLPQDAQQIADALLAAMMENKIGRVMAVYTQAQHANQQVVCQPILPLTAPSVDAPYMPHPADVDELVRHYVWARLYAILCDASCALNYKRMTSMQQASNNGEEMIATLTTQYNHERQAAITNELNDTGSAKVANEETV